MFPNLACLVSPLQTASVNTIFLQGLTGMRIRTIKKKKRKKRDFCKIPLWIDWFSFHLHCFALDSMERATEHQPFNLDLSLREWIQWNLSCLNQVIPSNVELSHYKYNKNIQSYCQDVYFFLPFSVFFHGRLLNIYVFFLHTSVSSFKTSHGFPRITKLFIAQSSGRRSSWKDRGGPTGPVRTGTAALDVQGSLEELGDWWKKKWFLHEVFQYFGCS